MRRGQRKYKKDPSSSSYHNSSKPHPKMTTPYSLENPPQAPKKRVGLAERRGRLTNIPKLVFPHEEEEKPERPEWRTLADSGYVRIKFLRFTPEDVAEIDDIDRLMKICDWYFPASQPQNLFEATYIDLVREAAEAKLYNL